MSIACIIGTSALASSASTALSSGGKGVTYDRRAWLLRNLILPTYRWAGLFSEVVVVGEWEPSPGVTWVPFDSVYRNCADALLKRQVGFDALRRKDVEWVLFQHDDHLYSPMNIYPTHGADVLSPARWTFARSASGEALNDGHTEGYVNGHACLMRPSCFAKGFRWDILPPVFTWDKEMTDRLGQLGLRWGYRPDLRVYDVEIGATPWR